MDEPSATEDGAAPYGPDLFTEAEGDPDTLANLGPLAPLAGTWEGTRGTRTGSLGIGSLRDALSTDGLAGPRGRRGQGSSTWP